MTLQLALMSDEKQHAFETFHENNPDVYDELVRRARQWKAAGHNRCSMKQLFEVLRFDRGIDTVSGDGFKLNNTFTAYYARKIEAEEPDLRGLFEMRVLRS